MQRYSRTECDNLNLSKICNLMSLGMLTTLEEVTVVELKQHSAFIICTNNNSDHVSKAKVANLPLFSL